MKVKEYTQLESFFKDKYYNFAYCIGIGMLRTVTFDKEVILNAEVVNYFFFEEFYCVSINVLYSGSYQTFVRLGRRF